jgi:hypothetical protein
MTQPAPFRAEITFDKQADADLLPLVQDLQKKGQFATVVKALMRLHIGKPATLELMAKLYDVQSALLAQLNAVTNGDKPQDPPVTPQREDDPLLDNL